MKVLVIGSGSLAIAVIGRALARGHEVQALQGSRARASYWFLSKGVQFADVVINCHGQNPKRGPTAEEYLTGSLQSALLVAKAAQEHNTPCLTISTDCVLGKGFGPDDLYGYVMSVRENLVVQNGGIAVRSSFVTPREGLWRDVQQLETFTGWTAALWSGGLVTHVADGLITLAEVKPGGGGVIAIATEKASTKYEIAEALIENFGYPCALTGDDGENYVDRTMAPSGLPGTVLRPFGDLQRRDFREASYSQGADPMEGHNPLITAQQWEEVWSPARAPEWNR